jgi:hypothetical protein
MSKTPRVPVSFPPVIRDIIKRQVGILGSSESEVVKNIVLIYFTEKGLLRRINTRDRTEGRTR